MQVCSLFLFLSSSLLPSTARVVGIENTVPVPLHCGPQNLCHLKQCHFNVAFFLLKPSFAYVDVAAAAQLLSSTFSFSSFFFCHPTSLSVFLLFSCSLSPLFLSLSFSCSSIPYSLLASLNVVRLSLKNEAALDVLAQNKVTQNPFILNILTSILFGKEFLQS